MAIPVGTKAEKGDFFGRTRELEDLWGLLESNHVVLSGPRRLGKTSLLQRIVDDAPARGWHAALIDVQGHSGTADLFSELDRALPDAAISRWFEAARKASGSVADRLRKIELKLPGGFGGALDLQAPPPNAWAKAAQGFQARVSTRPVLILIDEFSVFLEKLIARDRDGAEHLLGWLRTWRMASNVQCRFVFSGSIGINTLLTRHRLITYFNDCYDFRLQAFLRAEATAMLREELQREKRGHSADVPERICDRVGWLSPYYVNLLLVETLRAARDRETEERSGPTQLNEGDVNNAYERLLAVRSRFIHWHQRLERDLPANELTMAMKVLAAVAARPEGLSRAQLMARLNSLEPDPDIRAQRLDRVLWHLEEDGYLVVEGNRIQFLSFLLRDYWLRNHGR